MLLGSYDCTEVRLVVSCDSQILQNIFPKYFQLYGMPTFTKNQINYTVGSLYSVSPGLDLGVCVGGRLSGHSPFPHHFRILPPNTPGTLQI